MVTDFIDIGDINSTIECYEKASELFEDPLQKKKMQLYKSILMKSQEL